MNQDINNQHADVRAAAQNTFRNFMQTKGMRCTSERMAILNCAFEIRGHFDAQQLSLAMEKCSYHVSKATVYNTLELLCEAGLLVRHHIEGRQASYEAHSTDHLHLVCTGCGKVQELPDTSLTSWLNSRVPSGFNAIQCTVYAYGLCSDCNSLHKKKQQTS